MGLPAFRRLHVWQRSRSLAITVFKVTGEGRLGNDWSLRDQMRRAALSVPCNIAEGSGRGAERDGARFFRIARGSLAELATQADICEAIGFLDPTHAEAWQRECDELGAMLSQLIKKRLASSG